MNTRYTTRMTAILAAVLLPGAGRADESHVKLQTPGFRPESDRAAVFIDRIPTAEIAVFPAIVKTIEGTSHAPVARGRVVTFLHDHALGLGHEADVEFDTSGVKAMVQWEAFQGSIKAIGEQLSQYTGEGDYVLVTEYLVTPTRSGGMAVGGIHCYILDRSGANVFSFLLNSHHKMFVDAELTRDDRSAESQAWLVDRSTEVVLEAFKNQVTQPHHVTSDE